MFVVLQYCEAFANVLVGNLDGGVIRYLLLIADLVSRVQFPPPPQPPRTAGALPPTSKGLAPHNNNHCSDFRHASLYIVVVVIVVAVVVVVFTHAKIHSAFCIFFLLWFVL